MSKPLAQVTAAILAGGQGTRLRTVLADRQKVVAPIGGRPFLCRLLDQLADAGACHVVLCTGHGADQVRAMIGERYRDLRITYSTEPAPRDTAGALRQALPLLESDPVLAMNGDSFCELDLAAFLAAHDEHAGTLAVTKVAGASRHGRVAFDASGTITNFVEKAGAGGLGWINAGVYLLSRRLIESIPAERAVSIERETFPAWVGHGLFAFQTRGKFVDIGTQESYIHAQHLFQ